jgi:flagellar motor switch protein FliN/FliY
VHFAASTGTHAVVVLDTAWVAALAANLQSEESTEDEEAWLRRVATQGYEAVRSQLVGAASLPEVSIQLLTPESVQAHLSEPVYRIPFHLASSFQTLDGFVLLSAAEATTLLQPAPSMPDSENTIAPAAFPDLGRETLGGDGSPGNLDLLADIELEVTVELGQRRLSLADVLRLSTGSVVELEKVVGEPLEVYANGRLIAEGEAVVIDEHFGIRITRLVSGR